ncbi:MAG TPA: hypothetical protein VKR06_02395 [Ktedonosporobacter sp.]|nr:hypothetical protein [Ktedonosporobacter sp.]
MMNDRDDLDQLLHALRGYHTAVALTQTGVQQLRTPEQLARLERRLQVAYAAKGQFDRELESFLANLHQILEAQQNRLDRARQRREQENGQKDE